MQNRKVHVHCFSNNRSWVFAGLLNKGYLRNAHSVVFDSAPFITYADRIPVEVIDNFARGMTSYVLNAPIYNKFPLAPFFWLFLRIFTDVICTTAKYQPIKVVPDYVHMNRNLRDLFPLQSKVCFIYSSGDAMMPTSAIQRFRNELEAKGVKCSEKLYGDDVQHTGAFFKYTEEYCKLLDKLVFDEEY